MARPAEHNQILGSILPLMRSKPLVMDLQVLHGAAYLASPVITSQNFEPELLIHLIPLLSSAVRIVF